MLESWRAGGLGSWRAGGLENWRARLLESWRAGGLESWRARGPAMGGTSGAELVVAEPVEAEPVWRGVCGRACVAELWWQSLCSGASVVMAGS